MAFQFYCKQEWLFIENKSEKKKRKLEKKIKEVKIKRQRWQGKWEWRGWKTEFWHHSSFQILWLQQHVSHRIRDEEDILRECCRVTSCIFLASPFFPFSLFIFPSCLCMLCCNDMIWMIWYNDMKLLSYCILPLCPHLREEAPRSQARSKTDSCLSMTPKLRQALL